MSNHYYIYWTAGIDGRLCNNDSEHFPNYDLNTAHQELSECKERYPKCDGFVKEVERKD